MKSKIKVLTAALSAAMLLGAVGVSAGAAEVKPSDAVAASATGEAVSAQGTPQITETVNLIGGVKISRDKVEGAEAYRVFYLGKSGWRGMGNTTSTSFVDDDVNSGSTYTYTVRCVKEDGSAWMSDYNHDGWKATYIAPPELTAAYSDFGGVRIDWKAPKGATKFRVFYKGASGWRSMADVTGTTYLDEEVTSGKTYLYTVRAINNDGSAFVSGYDANGIYGSYVAAPTIVKAESTNDGIRLAWTPSAGAYKYRVYYKGRSGWVRFGETLGTYYYDDDVNSGSTYTYTVRALDKDDNFVSGYNAEGWKGTYIAAPKISSCVNTNDGVQINWSAVRGAEMYRVYVKEGNTWVGLGNTTSTSLTDPDLISGIRTYTVRCVDKNGNWVSDYDHTGYTTTYVSTPYIYRYTTDAETNVTIYWTDSGAAQYRVFYYSGGTWVGLGNTSNTSFKIKQNPVATTYTVRCLNANGSFISGYDPVGVIVRRESYAKDVDTTIPEIINYKINEDHKISLSWDPVPRVALYYVYLETADGGLKKVGETEERTCTINKSALGTNLAGKTFIFRIRGLDKNGKIITDYNPTGYYVTYPDALDITGQFATSAKDAVTLSWKALPAAETYKIYVYHEGSDEASVIETSRTTYKVRLEYPDDYYAFEVQAYDKDDNIVAIPGKMFEVNP